MFKDYVTKGNFASLLNITILSRNLYNLKTQKTVLGKSGNFRKCSWGQISNDSANISCQDARCSGTWPHPAISLPSLFFFSAGGREHIRISCIQHSLSHHCAFLQVLGKKRTFPPCFFNQWIKILIYLQRIRSNISSLIPFLDLWAGWVPSVPWNLNRLWHHHRAHDVESMFSMALLFFEAMKSSITRTWLYLPLNFQCLVQWLALNWC